MWARWRRGESLRLIARRMGKRRPSVRANGLLRQYLPHNADLRQLSQDRLDTIAAELNGRPRQPLGFQTPS